MKIQPRFLNPISYEKPVQYYGSLDTQKIPQIGVFLYFSSLEL
jgi:hypothetical protein